MQAKKFVITGGGTGGHVFPALCIAEELRNRGHEVFYVGTSRGMESKLVPEKGFPFFTVKTGAVKNQGLLKLVSTAFQLFAGILWSIKFLLKHKPDAVIGVGGYVSAPICLAAFVLRKPLFLQEQNSSVGIANRTLGKLADKIFLGFEQAKEYFPAKKCLVTGNPLRPDFFQGFPPYRADANFLLVMGGSLGARAINEALIPLLPKLKETFPELRIRHQTGQTDFDSVVAKVGPQFSSWYEPVPFIRNVVEAYGMASAVVGRSGALTVSELMQAGRPAIFVPFPRKGQNDQITNAYFMQDRGVGRVVEQGEGFASRFAETLMETLKPDVLKGMASRFEPLRGPNGVTVIANELEKA